MCAQETERRGDPRADELHATVLVRFNPGVTFAVENISIGGCSMVGPITLSIGDRVQILFEVDDAPVELLAEVVRAEHVDILNDRIAVRFIEVQHATRELIQRLVARALELACAQIEQEADR